MELPKLTPELRKKIDALGEAYLKRTEEEEALIEEDCLAGEKAGNAYAVTNPAWKEDWLEFIKHDHQWDPVFLETLLIHKLELLRAFYDPEAGNSSTIKPTLKKKCREIDKALILARIVHEPVYPPSLDFEERKKLRKKARRDFFLYLADHYENWWD